VFGKVTKQVRVNFTNRSIDIDLIRALRLLSAQRKGSKNTDTATAMNVMMRMTGRRIDSPLGK
jgi:hypothetical protein